MRIIFILFLKFDNNSFCSYNEKNSFDSNERLLGSYKSKVYFYR